MKTLYLLIFIGLSFSLHAQEVMPELARNLEYADKGQTQEEVLDRLHQNYTNQGLSDELQKYQEEIKKQIQENMNKSDVPQIKDDASIQKARQMPQLNNPETEQLLKEGIVRSYDENGRLESEMFLNEGFLKVYNEDGSYKVMNYGNTSKGEEDGTVYIYDSPKKSDSTPDWNTLK